MGIFSQYSELFGQLFSAAVSMVSMYVHFIRQFDKAKHRSDMMEKSIKDLADKVNDIQTEIKRELINVNISLVETNKHSYTN
jgi:hypothetical protein